jgi:hypothetical protein
LIRVRQRILARRFANGYKASIGKDGSHLKDTTPMLSSDLDRLTPIERLFVEQALVMAKELEAAADSAPEGQVIDRCESFMLGFGRDFLRRMLESTIQMRAEDLEKKVAPLESAPVGRRDGTKGTRRERS